MNKQITLFDILESEDTFNFDEMKQRLIDNLDMLKSMSVQEQTLYKKWQEMNKGGKMAKIKKKLLLYKHNLWIPTDIFDLEKTIEEIENLKPYVKIAEPGKGVTEWVNYRTYHTNVR